MELRRMRRMNAALEPGDICIGVPAELLSEALFRGVVAFDGQVLRQLEEPPERRGGSVADFREQRNLLSFGKSVEGGAGVLVGAIVQTAPAEFEAGLGGTVSGESAGNEGRNPGLGFA